MNKVQSHWHQMLDFRPFTPEEFYTALTATIKGKQIPKVVFQNVTHAEGGVLSANRKYLRVMYKEYLMDICAAPYAKDSFFVSWWLGDSKVGLMDFLHNIPFIGKLFEPHEKTFYEKDTEIMFKEIVAQCVKETFEEMTKQRGERQVILADWQGEDYLIKGA